MLSNPRLIIDGHLDLAFNALHLRRDLTQEAAGVRSQDEEETRRSFGTCTVTLAELQRGRVGIVFGTVMVRLDPKGSYAGTGMRTQLQCAAMGRGHAAYYEALERTGRARLIRSLQDLDQVLKAWRGLPPGSPAYPPLGVILALEGSDPIQDPDEVWLWHELGLRAASLCHYGTGAYAHGTKTEGGLMPRARPLLRAFSAAGVLVDVTHLADRAFRELLEVYDGPLMASHHNCRALVPGQRQLDDEMICDLVERGAVIGTSFDLWMLDPAFRHGRENLRRVGLEAVADHMDHVCQLAGSSSHAAVGSDLDGGFGLEQSPKGMDTIADIGSLAGILSSRGYSEDDLTNIFYGNWERLLRRVLR